MAKKLMVKDLMEDLESGGKNRVDEIVKKSCEVEKIQPRRSESQYGYPPGVLYGIDPVSSTATEILMRQQERYQRAYLEQRAMMQQQAPPRSYSEEYSEEMRRFRYGK